MASAAASIARVVVAVDERAELVAAEPVGARRALERRGEPRAEPRQQRVARRVAERVVVLLEVVEVEQQQRRRLAALALGERLVEVDHQRAAVAEPGQRVRRRLALGLAQQPQVLGEAGGDAHEHQHERGDGERGRALAERLDPAVDQHRERSAPAAPGVTRLAKRPARSRGAAAAGCQAPRPISSAPSGHSVAGAVVVSSRPAAAS